MRLRSLLLLSCISARLTAQTDTAFHLMPVKRSVFEPHVTIATLSLGFIDEYRTSYSLPQGYIKSNTTGFAPVALKLEYATGRWLGIAAAFGYDAFQYNFSQVYTGNGTNVLRYRTDKTRVLSGGLTGFYHFGRLLRIRHLDPFVGAGFSINNITHDAYPAGELAALKTEHSLTPTLQLGGRYFITSRFSLYGDVSADRHTVLNVGVSFRFMKPRYYADEDRDGVPDYADSCIGIPGKAQCNGCPDTDDDGIPDASDACPGVKGISTLHGCPDTDGDGIADKDDQCPTLPGTAANNGCPAAEKPQPAPVPAPQPAIPEQQPLPATPAQQPQLLGRPILFKTGSAVVATTSLPDIEQIAATLKANKAIVLQVDGHADATGGRAVNMRISLARAMAVKKALSARGVSPERIITAGLGSAHPAATNHTATGRAQNRRVTVKAK